MDWIKILSQIFEVCIIPLLGVLTLNLVNFIKEKSNQIARNSENELKEKYICMLADTISDCVIATNQTYVNYLKERGEFTIEAQKEAFRLTYDSVLSILTDEAKSYLAEAYGDLNIYLTKKIEAEVNLKK